MISVLFRLGFNHLLATGGPLNCHQSESQILLIVLMSVPFIFLVYCEFKIQCMYSIYSYSRRTASLSLLHKALALRFSSSYISSLSS
jgi:hypothetical protein